MVEGRLQAALSRTACATRSSRLTKSAQRSPSSSSSGEPARAGLAFRGSRVGDGGQRPTTEPRVGHEREVVEHRERREEGALEGLVVSREGVVEPAAGQCEPVLGEVVDEALPDPEEAVGAQVDARVAGVSHQLQQAWSGRHLDQVWTSAEPNTP